MSAAAEPERSRGAAPPRLSERAFPPYRFVPGRTPHPFAHPGGWGYGSSRPVPPYVSPEQWRQCENFLFGCDLFNAGWWWEAHEVWEELWHVTQAQHAGWTDLLKGLIQLAACALNRERGVHGGAERLLASAVSCLERVLAEHSDEGLRFAGLELPRLIDDAWEHLDDPGPPRPGLFVRPG